MIIYNYWFCQQIGEILELVIVPHSHLFIE